MMRSDLDVPSPYSYPLKKKPEDLAFLTRVSERSGESLENKMSPDGSDTATQTTPLRGLDLGCGDQAQSARFLAERGIDVTAVDIDPDICRVVRERLAALDGFVPSEGLITHAVSEGKVRITEGDMSSLEEASAAIEPGGFDTVICFYSLHHIPQKELSSVIASFLKWLRPGGILALAMLLDEAVQETPIEEPCPSIDAIPTSGSSSLKRKRQASASTTPLSTLLRSLHRSFATEDSLLALTEELGLDGVELAVRREVYPNEFPAARCYLTAARPS